MKNLKSTYAILFIIFCISNSFGQLPEADLNAELERLDEILLTRKSNFLLRKVDSLQTNKRLSTKQHTILSVYRLQAITDLDRFEESIRLSEELDSSKILPNTYKVRVWIKQALIYEILEDFDNSIKKLDSVELYYNNHEKDYYYGVFLYRKASLYRFYKSKNESLKLAKQAKQFGEKEGYSEVIATASMVIDFLRVSNDPEERLENLTNAKYHFEKINNYKGVALILRNISGVYIEQGDFNKAKKILFEALKNAQFETKDKSTLYYVYLKFSQLYEMQKRPDSALYYYKLNQDIRYEIIVAKQSAVVKKVEAENERLKIELEEKRYTQQLLTINKEKKWLIYALSFLIVFLSLIIILWLRILKKNKENKKQKKEIENQNKALNNTIKERNILLKELNHRVKNNLALIVSLIKFHNTDSDNLNNQHILENLENRVTTIAKAHEQFAYSDSSSIDDKIDLKNYLIQILEAPIIISKRKINYKIDINNIMLNMDTLLPVGILINELVTNSVKHAKTNNEALQLHIKCTLIDNKLLLNYSDSGLIFKENSDSKQLGLFIIKSMVQQLNGTYKRAHSKYEFSLNLKKND